MKPNQEKIDATLAGLELAVKLMIRPENLNKWISVREKSITNVLKSAEVDINFSSAFMEEMRNVGLIETTSSGAGMRYMVKSLEIPDSKFLAQKIYDNYKDRKRANKVNDGYPSSSAGDLVPEGARKRQVKASGGSVKIIPHEIAKLGDIGYIVDDNSIKEVMVIGISYDHKDRKRIVYDLECSRRLEGQIESYAYDAGSYPRSRFYKTVAEALQSIKVCKYVRRK